MDDNKGNPLSERVTTFQDLPPDAVFEILARIDELEALDNAQQVCKTWHSIMDEMLGIIVIISDGKTTHPSNIPGLSEMGIGMIAEIGVQTLFIRSELQYPLELPVPIPLPALKRPHMLKILIMGCPIPGDLFSSLVSQAFNLTMLILSFPDLVHLNASDLEGLHLHLPKLTYLKVGHLRSHASTDGATSLPNLRTLLKGNHFRQLKTFHLEFPVERFDELETIGFLIPFLQRHRLLKELNFRMSIPWLSSPPQRSTNEENLKAILLGIRNVESLSSLKVLELEGRPMDGIPPQKDVLIELLQKTCSLKRLVLEIGPVPDQLLERICSRNGSTLKELIIDQLLFPANVEPVPSFNLGLLSSLQCLRELQFDGSLVFSGARHLPPTLKYVSLKGAMPCEDVEHILLRLPNLSTVFLRRVWNGQEGYGFRMETIHQLVQNRKVAEVRLRWPIIPDQPSPFPEDGISNGDPANPEILKVKVHAQKKECILWVLNKDGYYSSDHSRV